jgi:hypothetical protein
VTIERNRGCFHFQEARVSVTTSRFVQQIKNQSSIMRWGFGANIVMGRARSRSVWQIYFFTCSATYCRAREHFAKTI